MTLPGFSHPATSEQIRWALGLFTPSEQEAQARRETENAQRQAKEATKGRPLFDLEAL
ncbi:MAG: hypothetical protein HY014_05395 [Acidobacteria bacterium]|nr:hypothetical protein [Acidobacteriota bacterium]MBI3487587.1 hypothetical protein [Acidobacteriota bacterium]